MLTGHEKRYAAIFGLTTLISILAQIAVLPSFGVIGVAIVSSLTRMLAYGLLSWQCAVQTGLDPTILAFCGFGPVRGDRTAPPMKHRW
jgi:hypothetical protein